MYIHVLIDTWWNVNAVACHSAFAMSAVLIDTWWNVNERKKYFIWLKDGF